MVGIVIVSHSKKIAEGLTELARQMTPNTVVPIAAAGGVDDPESPLGTDVSSIYAAIESVDGPEGVCIFTDLGSARLSAETAVELFAEEARERLLVCEAPLVEGVLVAVTQSSAGADREAVAREAAGAVGRLRGGEVAPEGEQADKLSLEITLTNPLGLHARPAARLVSLLGPFDCSVRLRNATRGGDWADAKSMTGVLTRDAREGDRVLMGFAGRDSEKARRAVLDLVGRGFDEPPRRSPPAGAKATGVEAAAGSAAILEGGASWELKGLRISPGFALGPAIRHRPVLPEVADRPAEDIEGEVERLGEAIGLSRKEIGELEAESRQTRDVYESSIFQAHLLFLDDPALAGRSIEMIRNEGITAESAWYRVVRSLLAEYAAIEDETLRARAEDLRDVAARILRHLSGGEPEALPGAEGILLVPRLNPSEVTAVERSSLLAVCSAGGSRASHSAILSRSLAIPVLFGLGEELGRIEDGTPLAIDGERGILYIRPAPETVSEIETKRAAWRSRAAAARSVRDLPSATADGRRIQLLANIAGIADLEAALSAGAEGVGLFRTEFLFMGRDTLPDEEEQAAIYDRAAALLAERPLVARTLDSGGDKPVVALGRPPEPNPFLGERGIRLTLAEPALFRSQIRALLRASRRGNLRIMLPMVCRGGEIETTRALIEAERPELPVKLGIMVEVPAAVQMLDHLLPLVDFVSIGTNDLAQYIMAADRTNSRVEELADPLQPAVLRAVAQIVGACGRSSVPVSLCGELAGSREAIPLLVGLGLTSLSMNPALLPEAKLVIAGLRYPSCLALAEQALECATIEEVRALLAGGGRESPRP